MNDFASGNLFAEPTDDVEPSSDPQQQRQKALAGTPDERAQFTWDVPISCDAYRKANRYIDALLARSKITNHPGGLWIIGDGGSGKTFILERLLKRLKPREGTYRRICPVLYLNFEARPSQGEVYARLLLQLGQDPRSMTRMSISELKKTLKSSIETNGVLLIAFDEAQHLWVMSGSRRAADAGGTIGSAIKLLYDELGVAFVFLGTTPLEAVRQGDSQTTRWPGVVHLSPFSFDDQFIALLATLDECIPMPQQANLASPKLAKPIFESCKGNFRLLKMLLTEAVRVASEDGVAFLTSLHLAKAYFLVHCSEDTPFGSA